MTFYCGSLRDEVYTRLLVKRTANAFTFNDFVVEKTWRPYSTLEALESYNPAGGTGGKVWVVNGVQGDVTAVTRGNAGVRFYTVMLAYQRVVGAKIDDLAFMDTLGIFMQELEFMCRQEIGDVNGESNPFSFSRLEFLKDENGTPYFFTCMRKAMIFESYFTAYYNVVHS